jgi:thiopeptide-type bacteriocin biosynthesis protein
MKIKLINKVICRTPAFYINDKMADVLEEFKLKIKEASPAFFEFIASIRAEELSLLNEKASFTLWKYFNRAKYRSTPFGSFAAITSLPTSFSFTDPIMITKEMDLDHFIDWSYKEHYLKNLSLGINLSTLFLSNSSIYFTGNEIRYIKLNQNFHELAAVNAIPELCTILTACKDKITCNEIYGLMQQSFEMESSDTKSLLLQLVSMQLLSTQLSPNITGNDYFDRIKIKEPKSAVDYIIAKRKYLKGSFNSEHLKHLPALVNFLNQHLITAENADLRNFKQLFVKRFEHQEVSLALVMDPEIGICYGNLAQQHGTNPLITEIKQAKPDRHQEMIAYSEFHAFLLNKIVEGLPIFLEEFEHNPLKSSALLPNTFSVIFHLYKAQPVIAFAGGCTANALIGRFTMGNEELENYGKEIAAFEMDANKDAEFFDIAYQAEKRVDNVNRRKILYPNELPILTWTELENPLDFTDILVSVYGDEVILKSKKLGKRIIPRIPSAYNYTRSDLAAYRFLCDIQSQGLVTNLSFKLQDFFPKLQYYPRVSYKGIIVSPAMWKVPSLIYKQTTGDELLRLKEWLQQKEITFRFKAGYGDHTLCFDPDETEDLLAFISFCKQQQSESYVTEALIAKSDCIKDETGGQYVPQYIANYQHQEELYPSLNLPNRLQAKHERIKLPGSEWLYFELYCHTAKSNQLLIEKLDQFLKNHIKQLKKWFFIRYNDPSNHIRLRLQLKDRSHGFAIIAALKAIIEPEMQSGKLVDFKIKTYFRETERYGAKRIDLIEEFFFADSRHIMYLLKKVKTEDALISSCLTLLISWLETAFSNLTAIMFFVENMANNFAAETVIGPIHFKKINTNFNELKGNIADLTVKTPVAVLNRYQQLIKAILNSSDSTEREKLLADLIHMHINRLFSVDQRMYETIIYHYLLRMLQIKRAISKA